MSLGNEQKFRIHVDVEGGLLHASLHVPISLIRKLAIWMMLILFGAVVAFGSPDIVPRITQLMPVLVDTFTKLPK